MGDTAKLKAPKGTSAISVLGQEYKVIKGFVTVAVEHIAELVGHGFTGVDEEEAAKAADPTLPAGVTSNLEVSNQGGYTINTAPDAPAPADAPPVADANLDPTAPPLDPNAPAPAPDAPVLE